MTAEEYLRLIHPVDECEPNPTYYTILEAKVRYSKEISYFEKILYSEIVLLTKAKGVCFATNNYFAKIFDEKYDYISRSINNLKAKGFIKTEIIYKPGSKQILGRVIYIPLPKQFAPTDNYDENTGYYQNQYDSNENNYSIASERDRGIAFKQDRGIASEREDNNTSFNITRENRSTHPTVKKSTYEEIKGESIDFEAGVVSWYAKLTGRPISDIRQIPDFKTPENRSILEKAFANRKTDWRVAIEKAGERSLSSNPSYRWKDFLQTLYVRLAEDEETETAFEIPDNYKNCIEYYIQDCDWDTDKFLSACKCLLARVDKKHFTNTQLDDLARAFENREAHAGYALMFAYDRALYKRDYFNLNFFDKILTYLRDTGDTVPRSPKNEGIIRVKYNIIFDNYQSDTPKETKLELKRKREAADGMRYTELGTVDLPAKPKIEKVEEIEEVEESEPIEKTMAYINDIKKKLGNSWNFNA